MNNPMDTPISQIIAARYSGGYAGTADSSGAACSSWVATMDRATSDVGASTRPRNQRSLTAGPGFHEGVTRFRTGVTAAKNIATVNTQCRTAADRFLSNGIEERAISRMTDVLIAQSDRKITP
jgi:hypothetical protein